MIYPATAKGGVKVEGVIPKDAKRIIGVLFKPDVWAANTVYYRRSDTDYDVIIAPIFTGVYYRVKNPGKSGATAPIFSTKVGDTFSDGSVIWETVAYNLMDPTVDIVDSIWEPTMGVTLVAPSFTTGISQVMIDTIPDGVTAFEVKNHVVKSTDEQDDVTFVFKVGVR